MFVERFRRGLNLHPEFSEQLSDFDRSALWRSNYKYAAGIALCKVLLKNNVRIYEILIKIFPSVHKS